MSSNPFSLQTSSLPLERIVDREEELDELLVSLLERRENILLLGENGVGKTCLLRKLRHKLQTLTLQALDIIEIEAREIRRDSTDFMERILSSLFKHVWATLANRPFSDLMFGLSRPEDIDHIGAPGVRTLMRLYQHFRSSSSVGESRSANAVGAKAIVSAERRSEYATSFHQEGLKPWEYTELMGDVLALLSGETARRVLVFADEANHIDPELQIDIFRSNLDSFLRRDVQFVFTARRDLLERIPALRDAFMKVVTLESFRERSTLATLIDIYLRGSDSPILFSTEAVDRIWMLSAGHPARLQRLCQESYSVAERKGVGEVSLVHVFDASLRVGQWELR